MSDQMDQKPAEGKPPEEPKKPESGGAKSWWTTLPGILTALTGLIVAITGLVAALNNIGLFQPKVIETSSPTLTITPTQTLIPASTATSMPSNLPTPSTTPQIPPTSTNTATLTQPLTSTNTAIPIPPTSTPTLTPPPVTIQTMDLCVKPLDERVSVREGPDTSTRIMGPLASDACLTFDLRLPDNSWVRIAQEQSNGTPHPYARGWVKSNLLGEAEEIEHLDRYFGETARQRLYCVTMLEGLYVRECPDTSCPSSGVLRLKDCLYFDGRLENVPWLRIAEEQENDKFAPMAHKWLSTEGLTLILSDFQSFIHKPDMKPYFDLLPIVTPPPTPGG